MSAFGMNECQYCGEQYHDLDEHKCKRSDLRARIDSLEKRIARLESDLIRAEGELEKLEKDRAR